jgi:hypothetical protein
MYANNTGAVQDVCVNGCIQKLFKYIVDARYGKSFFGEVTGCIMASDH